MLWQSICMKCWTKSQSQFTRATISQFLVLYRSCDISHSSCSPPPSSPLMGPLTLGPGHLWDQTGRCNRRSSWPAPLDHPRCSIERSRDTTCWTGAWEQTSHTCQLCPGPCSYLRMEKSSGSHCQLFSADSCICLIPYASSCRFANTSMA